MYNNNNNIIYYHRRRNHGGSGGWCSPIILLFSDSYIAIANRLNFIHTDHTALAYRSIEIPFTKPSSYASVYYYCTSAMTLFTVRPLQFNAGILFLAGLAFPQDIGSVGRLVNENKFNYILNWVCMSYRSIVKSYLEKPIEHAQKVIKPDV